MKITLTNIFVEDQEVALKFYTQSLSFLKKSDIPIGDYKWLTVVSPDGPADIELLLEPNENPAAKTYQKAIYEQGIPAASFEVDDVQVEYKRLTGLGVKFSSPPTKTEQVEMAVFDDKCGNLIQIHRAI